jgi:hypothetical protein
VLTRRVAASETLGAARVLCTDKTGTLTQNRMTIVALCAGADLWRQSDKDQLKAPVRDGSRVRHSRQCARARQTPEAGCLRARLESKMIEGGWNAESMVYPRIILCRHVSNSVRFNKCDKLIAPDVEKDVSNAPAFFDFYCVGDYWLETQHIFVKLPGLVQIKCRESDVGKASVIHVCYSSCSHFG